MFVLLELLSELTYKYSIAGKFIKQIYQVEETYSIIKMKALIFVLLGLFCTCHASKINPFYQTTCSALNTEVANLESKYGSLCCFTIININNKSIS